MDKIYLIIIEYFDGTKDDIIGYCKTEEDAITWMNDNQPKKGAGYCYWREACFPLEIEHDSHQ